MATFMFQIAIPEMLSSDDVKLILDSYRDGKLIGSAEEAFRIVIQDELEKEYLRIIDDIENVIEEETKEILLKNGINFYEDMKREECFVSRKPRKRRNPDTGLVEEYE